MTTSLMDFLPPTIAELPDIEIAHIYTMSPASLTGAKGVGEGGTIGAPAAIANAISDALSPLGVEVFHLPATPHRIRSAIREGRDVRPASHPADGTTPAHPQENAS